MIWVSLQSESPIKHKNIKSGGGGGGGRNWLYLRPYLKAFPVFNVLETCRVYLLAINIGIVKFIKKKIYLAVFEKCEICRRGPNYVQKL